MHPPTKLCSLADTRFPVWTLPVVLFAVTILLATGVMAADTPKQMIAKGRDLLGGPEQAQGIKLIKQAMAQLDQTIEKNPKDHAAYYQLSLGLYQMRQDDKAMQALERAIEIEPNVAQYHVFQARIYQANNRHDDAIHAMESAVALKPGDQAIQIDLAKARWKNGHMASAVAAFEEVLKKDSKNVDVIYYIGAVRMEQKKYELAANQFLKVIEHSPESANSHYSLGQAYQLMDKQTDALKRFEQVVKIDPNDYRPWSKIVQIYQALGKLKQRDEARTALLKLRESGKVPGLARQTRFCRDQFVVGTEKLMVFEYYLLRGPRGVKYAFYILDTKPGQVRYRITLEFYDMTNAIAREQGQLKKGERLFHLDGYFSGNSHKTYGMFKGEPSYDEIKKLVAKIVSGKQKAISSSKPNKAGGRDVEIK